MTFLSSLPAGRHGGSDCKPCSSSCSRPARGRSCSGSPSTAGSADGPCGRSPRPGRPLRANRRAARLDGRDPFTAPNNVKPLFRDAAEATLAANRGRWSESSAPSVHAAASGLQRPQGARAASRERHHRPGYRRRDQARLDLEVGREPQGAPATSRRLRLVSGPAPSRSAWPARSDTPQVVGGRRVARGYFGLAVGGWRGRANSAGRQEP